MNFLTDTLVQARRERGLLNQRYIARGLDKASDMVCQLERDRIFLPGHTRS